MVFADEITTGTEKVFNELRNMPCPHLDYEYTTEENKKHNSSDPNCKLGGWCVENHPEACPVIEALLIYIPWKREMIQEEDELEKDFNQSEDDYYNEMQRWQQANSSNLGAEDLGVEDWGEEFYDDDYGYLSEQDNNRKNIVTVTVKDVKMISGNSYRLRMKNGDDEYVGEFVNIERFTGLIRMTQVENLYHCFDINKIKSVKEMNYSDLRWYWRQSVCEKCMEVNQHYTIHLNSGNHFIGEFLSADALCIRMWDGDKQVRIPRTDIKGVDDIH